MSEARIPVFAGPSLPAAARPAGPFEWHPPAMAGDLIRLRDRPPAKLCLIDGYFDSRPAPWHKELLALMARGTIVFGASSMGALRAAELHPFGMVGIGAIFRAYRDGRLWGDDEVALIHATEALDWAPLSVPMVELRATLIAACRSRLIETSTARRLRSLLHEIHFSERDWPAMERACLAEGQIDALAFRRLRAMHVPVKRRDALACLAAARAWTEPARPCPAPPETVFIARLAEEAGGSASRVQGVARPRDEALAQLGRPGMVTADPV
jgi:hypothetical protein